MTEGYSWTVFKGVQEDPDEYMARLAIQGKPTETVIKDKNLSYIRVVIAHNYPMMKWYPRHENDHQTIVECWF